MKKFICLCLLYSVILVPTWFTGLDHPWAAWLVINRHLFELQESHFNVEPYFSDYYDGA